MTPKQFLRTHIETEHGKRGGNLPKGWTMNQLSAWHGIEHYRYSTNHFHIGANRGPDSRPEGWKTGANAVPNRKLSQPAPALTCEGIHDDPLCGCYVGRAHACGPGLCRKCRR